MFNQFHFSRSVILSNRYHLNTDKFLYINIVRTLLNIIFYFKKINLFSVCNFTGSNITNINFDLNDQIKQQILYFIIIGCVALVCGYIRTLFLNLIAERQIRIIRQILFQSILKKDIEYFDRHKTGELSTCLTDDVNKIQDGIGDKLGTAIEIVSTFISCLIIG
jgi:ABC-type multidrug transport system fused ATPase/permease subunit